MSLIPYMYPQVVAPSRGAAKKTRKSKRSNAMGPSPSSIVYSGPTRLPRSAQQQDLYVTQVNNQGVITTTAAGVIATVFDAYAQLTTPADWTNLSNLYTEYRILSMEVEMVPWNKYNTSTASSLTPLYSVVDRANNTPLASYAGAMSYESVSVAEPSTKLTRKVKMAGTGESDWVAIGSSPATADRLYIKLYSGGNVGSTNLYDFLTRVVVQLRGRQ